MRKVKVFTRTKIVAVLTLTTGVGLWGCGGSAQPNFRIKYVVRVTGDYSM